MSAFDDIDAESLSLLVSVLLLATIFSFGLFQGILAYLDRMTNRLLTIVK